MNLDNNINSLEDLHRDLQELADAFGRTGNKHVADQLRRMAETLCENIEELNNKNQ